MQRIRIVAREQIVVEEAAAPTLAAGDALVQVEVVGICGSDLHAYHDRHPFIHLPVLPGHEFAGTVTAVGSKSDAHWMGKRVTTVPSLVCGVCYNCRHGRYNICNELKVIGCQADGAMAELVRVPVEMLVELPAEMGMETGALVEPLAVAVNAVHRGGNVAGCRVMVFGAGPIGLFVTQVARAYGARELIVVDPQESRRAIASRLGADQVVDPGDGDVVAWAHTRYGVDGIDLSYECAGVAATVNTAIRVNRKGTRVVIAGVFAADVNVSMGLVQDREIELAGTLMYRKEHFDEAIWLLASGRVAGAPLVTHRFALAEAPLAFSLPEQKGSGALKMLLRP